MATTFRSRKDIPTALMDAKNSATANFLTKETAEPLAAFAARPNPSHNVVGIGIGLKFVKGKATGNHSIRFYVERKLPDRAIPMLPAALAADLCSLLAEKDRLCLCVIADRKSVV